jgi:hypothetical protein
MDFPCEIKQVSGSLALETYQNLKHSTGSWPVILGDPDEVDSLVETMGYVENDYATLLQQADSINPLAWFEKRQAQDPDYYDLTVGEWQDLSPALELSLPIDVVTGEPKTDVLIALVPVEHSWQIPAFLKIGGWNDCPTAAEHTAIFRYWHQHYGIRVASIGADVIELEIDRPPTTREQALQLAQQQFIYCPDIVYQGTQTIAALASTLLNGRVWFFWWD